MFPDATGTYKGGIPPSSHGLSWWAAIWLLCNQHCETLGTEASAIGGKHSAYAD